MDIEELKSSRSARKRRVTVLIRKLKTSLQYGEPNHQSIKSSLEEEFECLTDLDLQISEIENKESTYLDVITPSYDNVIKLFYDSLKEDKNIENEKKISIVKKIVDRSLMKVQTIMERVKSEISIKPSDLCNSDAIKLEVDVSALIDEVNCLLGNISSLGELTDISELESKADKVIETSEQLTRDAKVLLKLSKLEPQEKTEQDLSFTFYKELSLSSSTPISTEKSKSSLSPHAFSFKPSPATLSFKPSQATNSSMNVVTATQMKPSSTVYVPTVSTVKSDPLSVQVPVSVPLSYPSLNDPFGLSQKQEVTEFNNSIGQHCSGYSHAPSMNFGPPSRPNAIQTKKPSLPTFSGDRADWPEFRCVWISMAESQFSNRVQLAMELKRCCKGKAADRVRHIYVTNEHAYEEIWERLREEYDDPGLCSQEAINKLMSLKLVGDQDFSGLVNIIDTVDGIYNQLRELNQLNAVHAVDVDRVSSNLPASTRMEWLRRYRDLSHADKLSPFSAFVVFLRRERSAVARLAESMPKQGGARRFFKEKASSHLGNGTESKEKASSHLGYGTENKKVSCAVHGEGHLTKDCKNFLKFSVSQRYNCLRKSKRCFNCFGIHPRAQCRAPACASCGKLHNKLLCVTKTEVQVNSQNERKETLLASVGAMALYPICRANIKGSSRSVTVLLDGGSNASYVTSHCAQKNKLKRIDKVTLSVTTVGGQDGEYQSAVYEAGLKTTEGKIVKVTMYELPKITGKVSLLSQQVVEELFPEFDSGILMRPSDHVDILLGTDYFGLHPKEELSKVGENLSIMKGQLGVCLVGTHPLLKESDLIQGEVPRTLHLTEHRVSTHHTSLRGEHPAFSMAETFIAGEELGTECSPKCGACKCGKCPIPGHDLSFREEQELLMIRSNLVHDPFLKVWTTSYPWIKDPKTLPDNYSSAFSTMMSTERSLRKDPSWAESYQGQIVDMVKRGVVRKLTPLEIVEWNQPFFYISHLAVSNLKSKSTPVRIVFNSAQVYKGVSLNSFLAKGPDSYRNSVLGILLRWREEAVPVIGDISKMFHCVRINPLEQHCHRFLWRDLDTSRDPDTYIIQRVNMGDKPAPAIATEALFMTADKYADTHPRAARFINESSYVDDLIDSVSTLEEMEILTRDTEYVLSEGGFQIKCWQSTCFSSERETVERVLGISWSPERDTIFVLPVLNFSKKRHYQHTEPNLKKEDVPEALPQILTKRLVLQQVMGIYDPLGLIAPFTLLAKILLRETWQMGLDWDDSLPPFLYKRWVKFFTDMFLLEKLSFPRCLKPDNMLEDPWLLLLSDGGLTAYGCVAYVRWQFPDGSVKLFLIMSKCRIAPLHTVSVPRMELNGAVLSKRMRVCIIKEMRYSFKRILHLVDSETVLHMINKTSCRFKVYEGVRLGEIQSVTDVSEWAYVPREKNIADWLTRGKVPQELDSRSMWSCGPPMFYLPFEQWDIKFVSSSSEFELNSDSLLPGEKINVQTNQSESFCTKESKELLKYSNISTMKRAIRVVARLLGIAEEKSFRGGQVDLLSPKLLRCAETYLLLESQSSTNLTDKQYRSLNPAKNEKGLWVVGASRLAHTNPLGVRADLPVFIPKGHALAELAMRDCHSNGHRGRDATLALFRNRFWTPSGPALAKKVTSQCQLCKLRNGRHVEQKMGVLPVDRAKPSPPFNHSMVDLFGPYLIRGEVQKRISGKAWGVIFTDLASRAVHIEAIFGYDSSQVLMALTRFVSIRGWPEHIYSDPGTQLLSTNKELVESARRLGVNHGLQWIFGPADSPWHQGAVEALVKTAKKAIKFAINDQRLTAAEFLTVCLEVSNTINERPIGLLPSLDSEINVLTPNCLLLGRATASNPGGWQPEGFSLKTRFQLVSSIGEQFWKHWLQLFAPTLVYQSKWHTSKPDLRVGDVVLVADSNCLRGNYYLAKVAKTHPGKDGKVRSVTLAYKNYKVGESVKEYRGARDTFIVRSVQRLILLVPVDD